eukprot:1185303-Prorocentrum_minimum.AAC.4
MVDGAREESAGEFNSRVTRWLNKVHPSDHLVKIEALPSQQRNLPCPSSAGGLRGTPAATLSTHMRAGTPARAPRHGAVGHLPDSCWLPAASAPPADPDQQSIRTTHYTQYVPPYIGNPSRSAWGDSQTTHQYSGGGGIRRGSGYISSVRANDETLRGLEGV